MLTKEERLEGLIEAGFDASKLDEDDTDYIRVRCSQCASMVINGTATHERGCPNAKRRDRESLADVGLYEDDDYLDEPEPDEDEES